MTVRIRNSASSVSFAKEEARSLFVRKEARKRINDKGICRDESNRAFFALFASMEIAVITEVHELLTLALLRRNARQ